MADLVSTGIEGFDDIIGGGFPPGTCILLITPPIVESHLFCLEYMHKSILASEPSMMITMDYSPEDLKVKASQYGWDMESGEKNNLLRWVDGYSMNARRDIESTDIIKRVGGSIALSDLTIGMSQIQREFQQIKNYYKFVFDSLSILFIYNEPNAIYRFLRVVISKLRMSGGIGFFTLGTGMHDPKVEMTLRYMLDGTIRMNDDLELNVLSLPTPSKAKSARLTLSDKGFSIHK